jgi:hypothetical protein
MSSMTVRGKPRSYRSGAIDEQLAGIRRSQTADRHQDLARDAEGLAARGDQPQGRYGSDQGVGQDGGLIDDLFAIVDDDDQ